MSATAVAATPRAHAGTSEPVDYDLHGFVGIRLIDATARDAAVIDRQVGPIRARLEREPDISIRFVDRLEPSSPVRLLGVGDVGFTDDAFLVLRSLHKSPARVQIPFEHVGGRCEIVCERGLAAVPHLVAIVNLTALARGALPLHASAVTYRGAGLVATGWAKGGKTETLLAFLARGASYVGDEWVYFGPDGRSMFGIPEPIRVWSWHLDDLPRFRARVRRRDRVRLRALGATVGLARRLASRPFRMGLVRRALPLLEKQLYVHLPPVETFGSDRCPLRGSADKIFFVASRDAPGITVRPVDPAAIARRMVFSLQEERAELLSCYHRFRFAFPESPNELLDGVVELERRALERTFAGKEAFEVLHPYPVRVPSLFDALNSYI